MLKLSQFMELIDESHSIAHEDDGIDEKIIRKKVIRNGKLKRVKRTNREGYTSRGGKEKKISQADHLKASKTQKRASKKRAGKKSVVNVKRMKSNKKRKSLGL